MNIINKIGDWHVNYNNASPFYLIATSAEDGFNQIQIKFFDQQSSILFGTNRKQISNKFINANIGNINIYKIKYYLDNEENEFHLETDGINDYLILSSINEINDFLERIKNNSMVKLQAPVNRPDEYYIYSLDGIDTILDIINSSSLVLKTKKVYGDFVLRKEALCNSRTIASNLSYYYDIYNPDINLYYENDNSGRQELAFIIDLKILSEIKVSGNNIINFEFNFEGSQMCNIFDVKPMNNKFYIYIKNNYVDDVLFMMKNYNSFIIKINIGDIKTIDVFYSLFGFKEAIEDIEYENKIL